MTQQTATKTLIGDIHGDTQVLIPYPGSIQIGDFHLFGYDQCKFADGKKRYFIDGNHDNFSKLDLTQTKPYEVVKNLFHIPRGFVSGQTMFIGGGNSPSFDRRHRTAGYDWWPEENLNLAQLENIMAVHSDDTITTIVSHDAPLSIAEEIVVNHLKMDWELNLTSANLQHVLEYYKPSLWIFGHYHCNFDVVRNGTRFVCLNINRIQKFNLPLNTNREDFPAE